MAPRARSLAQSESKARFFDRLGLYEANKLHRQVYSMMKAEAIEGWARVTASRDSLLPQLKDDATIEPPYSFGQIDELAIHREVLRIYTQATVETKAVYRLGLSLEGNLEDNWVIRWLLWHVFRYRDERNSSSNRRGALTTNTNWGIEEPRDGPAHSKPLSTNIPVAFGEANGAQQFQHADILQQQFSCPRSWNLSSSSTRYWDPVREAFKS